MAAVTCVKAGSAPAESINQIVNKERYVQKGERAALGLTITDYFMKITCRTLFPQQSCKILLAICTRK